MLSETVLALVPAAAVGDAQALQALSAYAQHDEATELARRELSSELHKHLASSPAPCAEAWMLLATWQESAGETQSALRSWYRSSQPGAKRDATRMRALGLDTEAAWSTRAAQVRKLRAEYLRDAFADIRRAYGPRELFRIDRALAGYLGEASVFSSHPTQRPKVIFIPGLRTGGFLNAGSHPLVPALMAGFSALQREFRVAVSEGSGIEPFMGHDLPAASMRDYVTGAAGASWDALFVYRHGRRYDANHQRFPETSALLDSVDLCRIDGQAPEVCFSILQPHSRIEPHHGVTNARVVIHIPLEVPPGCFLDVTGVGRHFWQESVPMVFDDTFEHSAENPTDRHRGILLMDAWHPELTPPEREAFKALIEAITRLEA
ncbi:MAG: hypothetical protein RI988_296 [Pseudomonadota bacterium]